MSYTTSGSSLEASAIQTASLSLPLTIAENCINKFCWYNEDGVEEGMTFNGILHTLVSGFSDTQRMSAFEMARELAAQGSRVIVSVANSGKVQYQVWVDLRDWVCELG
ncbi:MAG: hypothetical protein VKJ46_01950 [Leptolyngbyaceae bacterium]|nr:hypothetical protein [Leptolyngbyaceae bacterium]